MNLFEYQDNLFQINDEHFDSIALKLFQFQAIHNPVYAEYLNLIGVDISAVKLISEIPFLPIDAYKYRKIKTGTWDPEAIFESSGTSNDLRSVQYVNSLDWYYKISQFCFNKFFGGLDDKVFFALMPHYLEQKNSSLITMLKQFVRKNANALNLSFYMDDYGQLAKDIIEYSNKGKNLILFGVSFGLLEFAEQYRIDAADLTVIETGGMKGRRKEISKSELHQSLRRSFPNSKICSEYGMTELSAQAYALDGIHFSSPFMKFLISDLYDPIKILTLGERGLINIIDLSNYHTCAFIKTADVGIAENEFTIRILGRADYAELRGCAQLWEGQ